MKITSTIKKLAKKISTPALIIDSKLLKKKFNTLRGEMGAIEIYYAMKLKRECINPSITFCNDLYNEYEKILTKQ